MEASGVSNDARGWIMCIVSGIACCVGACVICVDSLVRLLPNKKDFRIQDSNAFLASSLSLSFGVMIFSALNSMLPSSKHYLTKAGYGDQQAGLIMMGCFIVGFIGIQIVSRLLHQFMPTHVVDCDHTHDEHGHGEAHLEHHSSRRSSRARSLRRRKSQIPSSFVQPVEDDFKSATGNGNGHTLAPSESTPLLASEVERSGISPPSRQASVRSNDVELGMPGPSETPEALSAANNEGRRPSMIQVQKRVLSFMKDTKCNCAESGPCFGYTDPCSKECFKHLSKFNALANTGLTRPDLVTRMRDGADSPANDDNSTVSPTARTSRAQSHEVPSIPQHAHHPLHPHAGQHALGAPLHQEYIPEEEGEEEGEGEHGEQEDIASPVSSEDLEAQHHHHVPENAFLSIGLQTVIAIALHKFPEGFITYATNHANPALGFNVFMALFVHNIAEGFAMALPLFMALRSRLKAIAWSSLLGGLSQPLGAAVAVLWFRIARRNHIAIDNVAYACLFASTAGIMASVALQLFVESLSLNHNRNLSIVFAFLGMALLGFSNALVAE